MDSKKKQNLPAVLFCLDEFRLSGVTTFVSTYVNICTRNGIEAVILARDNDDFIDFHQFGKAHIYRIPSSMKSGLINRFLSGIEYIAYLNKILRKHRVITVHLGETWSSLYVLSNFKYVNIKKILTVHGLYHLEFLSSYQAKGLFIIMKARVLKMIQAFVVKHVSKIVVLSEYSKSLVINNFGDQIADRVSTIPGVILDRPVLSDKTAQDRIKSTIILNIGRAESRKGIVLLLKAFQILLKKIPDIYLYIASPVEYYKWSNDILETYEQLDLFKSVHFLHAVDDKQKSELFESASLFIIPSLDLETFGLTILESFQHGVPVVGTPVGAIPEILSEVDARFVAKSTSPGDLANSIQWYLSLSESKKVGLINKGFNLVKEKYSIAAIEHIVLQLYRIN